jgi:hypothetical protein
MPLLQRFAIEFEAIEKPAISSWRCRSIVWSGSRRRWRSPPLPEPGTGFHAMADVGDATVPLLDLRRRIPQAGSAPAPPCTPVKIEGALAGLVVDQVLRIEDIPADDVEDITAHPLLPIFYVARSGDRLMSVLVIDRVLPPLESEKAEARNTAACSPFFARLLPACAGDP